VPAQDQRFLMPYGPSADQGYELPRAWEHPPTALDRLLLRVGGRGHES
jgi:hypothetical protein